MEKNPEALTADGLESALIGVARLWTSGVHVAVYSAEKCIQVFMERDGMDEETVEEFFSFNVEGAYVGESTPLFVWDH